MNTRNNSFSTKSEIFWGEIAPCEHLVQLYKNDGAFLNSLEEFVCGAFEAGEGIIVIATPAHLHALEAKLRARGFDLDAVRERDQYIALDAKTTLSKFMVSGWPDATLFRQVVRDLLARASGNNSRGVRAFGEMVALLWADGHTQATLELEGLWEALCKTEAFSLFCAYPRRGLTQDVNASMQEICDAHSRVIEL
jgi:hypothetical protein